MLAARLLRHLRCDRALDAGAHDRPAQYTFGERRLVRRGWIAEDFCGGGLELLGRHETVDQAESLSLVRADGLAREHHVHRGPHADEIDGADGAAEPRMNTELHFG